MAPLSWRVLNLRTIFMKVDLEECQLSMHVDRVENILCDRYFVEFAYDPTCNYIERGKYDCRNFHVTKLPLVMLDCYCFFPLPCIC